MEVHFAFDRGEDITAADLLDGVHTMRTTPTRTARPKEWGGVSCTTGVAALGDRQIKTGRKVGSALRSLLPAVDLSEFDEIEKLAAQVRVPTLVGRKKRVAVRTAICNQILFCCRHSEALRINGFYISIPADGTLDDWAVEILLHTSFPKLGNAREPRNAGGCAIRLTDLILRLSCAMGAAPSHSGLQI